MRELTAAATATLTPDPKLGDAVDAELDAELVAELLEDQDPVAAPVAAPVADEEVCSLHGRSLHLARRAGDKTTIALDLCGLARVALHEDLDWARALGEEALAVVDGTDDRTARANALRVLEVAARMRDDPPDRVGWGSRPSRGRHRGDGRSR